MPDAGRASVGHGVPRRRRRITSTRRKVTTQAEMSRDRSRIRLFGMRRRYKLKVQQHEEEMLARRQERERSLNASARLETMPSRKYAKMLRNPVNWSSVPKRPVYSKVAPRERIYGKRFETWDKKIQQRQAGEVPKKHQEAAQKMAESVAELRKDIAERAKKLASEIEESTGESG